ncbi:dephospho-CoA kinase [Flavobacterium sp.]|uniref:dephospho-CoA kinase n=1 Tax=Flavobacterium sp. TaxID=239 RepID=UPI0038FC79FF
MTKIIGLTGGIGSGKTTIANYFIEKKIPVYIADDQAKEIMKSPEIISKIHEIFGDSIFNNGYLDRKLLAEIVFNKPEKLNALNEIIHPAVKNHFDNWILNYLNFPYIIYEAAILFESGSYKNCDYIITVISPIDLRIQRVMKRDNITREQVLNRIENQWTDEQRIAKSDYVIENINLKNTKSKINKILKILNIY